MEACLIVTLPGRLLAGTPNGASISAALLACRMRAKPVSRPTDDSRESRASTQAQDDCIMSHAVRVPVADPVRDNALRVLQAFRSLDACMHRGASGVRRDAWINETSDI